MHYIVFLCGLLLSCHTGAKSVTYQPAVASNTRPLLGADAKALPQSNPRATKGGEVRIAHIGTFDTIFPFPFKGIPCQGNGITDEAMVFEKLMYRQPGEPFTYYAWLAEGVAVDQEHKWIEFKLNPKAMWADGKPLTAEDVAFSITALKEQSRPIYKNHLKQVSKVEVKSSQVVRVYVDPIPDPIHEGKTVFARETLLVLCGLPVLPKHILHNRSFDELSQQNVIGSGPYEITDVQMGASVTYARRQNYWGTNLLVNKGRHNFDKVKFVYFRDPHIAFEALKAGEVDWMLEEDVSRRKNGHHFDALKSGKVILSALTAYEAPPMRGFVMNTRRSQFENLALRQALTFALDFDWLKKNLYDKHTRRSRSFFGNGVFADKSKETARASRLHIRDQMQRKKRVLELLQKAGYRVTNGVCVHTQIQKPLRLDLLIENNDSQKEAIAYARMLLKGYGIQLTIRKLDTAQFWHRVMDFDFEMVAIKWLGITSPGVEQRNRWTTESASRKGSLNWAGVQDQHVDVAVNQLLTSKTLDEQASATRSIDKHLRKGYYVIPLGYDSKRFVLHRSRLRYPETDYGQKVILEKSFWWDDTVKKSQ